MHYNAQSPGRAGGQYKQLSSPKDYHTQHDTEGAAKLSTTVIHALADLMERDVTDVGFVLYDSIDPDALDKIFSSTDDGTSRSPGHVAFTVDGYRVTVYSDGHIVITPPRDPADDPVRR